jgi:succinoglycan biosynthesis transport protein ExoP
MSESSDARWSENRAAQLVPAHGPMPVSHASRTVPALASQSAAEPTEWSGADLLETWRIIVKHKALIAGIAIAVLTLGTTWALTRTPLYSATVRLQIDRNAAQIVEGGNVAPFEGGQDHEFLRTQHELLQSRAVAERVVSALGLAGELGLGRPRSTVAVLTGWIWGQSSSGNGASPADRAREAVAAVLENRTVRPVSGSRLIDVTYTDTDPHRAERIANALADAFIAANMDKRMQVNAHARVFLEDQIKQLKLRLEDSEKALLEFAQREQIVSLDEKASIAESNLASANAVLSGLVAERIKNEQLWRQAEAADAINLPQLLSNTVVDGLRSQRNALVAEYQEKLETFKPGFPAMVQISNKIREIDRQLATEVRTIREALRAAHEASVRQEAAMREQIEHLRAEVLDFQKRSIRHNILKREVDTNRSLYNGLLQRYKEVDIAGGAGANNVFVVDRAEQPLQPSSPRLPRTILISLAIGLGAGLLAALLRERLDDTIGSVEEMESLTGLVTLGVIPRVETARSIQAELAEPQSSLAEAYRALCTALQFSSDNGVPKTLSITSAGASEGKSVTALAIARQLASAGRRVLLVDADLRSPSLHAMLGLGNQMGLSNYLAGAVSPPEVFQTTDLVGLTFMAAGPAPPSAADLLGSPRLLSLMSQGLEVFDQIVIDGPPVMDLADAQILAHVAAGTVFVVGAGEARTGLVRSALKRLRLAHAVLIGALVTKLDWRAAGYGYGHGYGERYGRQLRAGAGTHSVAATVAGGDRRLGKSA